MNILALVFIQATFILIFLFSCMQNNSTTKRKSFQILDGEVWWGGAVVDGRKMPFGSMDFSIDQNGSVGTNQAQPFFLSNKGRYLWCDSPLIVNISSNTILVESNSAEIIFSDMGKSLQEAFHEASVRHFPPSGKIPDPLLFTSPQYNTWIELQYNQNEEDILKYAAAIVENGFPTGVLMIDDNWQTDYGTWEFSSDRFSDPKGMIDKLHDMGFKVMVWVCPFISADSHVYRELARKKLLMFGDAQKNNPAIVKWWNGQSAVIDLSNPEGSQWYKEQLKNLVDKYGVDGFKLDAGDAHFYTGLYGYQEVGPNGHCELHAKIGLDFPLNEYRACWKMAGQPLVQRLRDKQHNWEDLQALIPDMLALGLIGHPFGCPDLIGGGEINSFIDKTILDEELIVRAAQVHALMPMMQFSVAPWRVLDVNNLAVCKQMAELHQRMGSEIIELAKKSAKTDEPIVRYLEYEFPGNGYQDIKDQFMLGEDILVAPVVEKGERSRKVIFPEGTWQGDDGSIVIGPTSEEITVPLERLPWYYRIVK